MKHTTAKFNQSGMHAVCHAAASPFDGRANDRRIRRPLIRLLGMALAWLVLGGCGMQPPVSTAVPANPTPTRHPSPTLPVTPPAQTQAPHTQTAADAEEAGTITHIQLEINGVHFTATLADTEAAQALATLLTAGPLTVEAHDYGGFEKEAHCLG